MKKKQAIIVLGAIIEKEGKILLARRHTGQSMAGLWEFPGGKLGAGETEKQCLKREVNEELKADIEVLDFFAESQWDRGDKIVALKCYKAKLLSDNVELNSHDIIAWVASDELMKYQMPPADEEIAKKMRYEGK
jgi:mutator protein MutT